MVALFDLPRPVVEPAWLRVPMLAVVGAGKNMADLPINGWRLIHESSKVNQSDTHCGALIQGDSLAGDGIHDGDIAIFKLNFEAYELTPGRIAAVLTPNGLLIKHVYLTLNEQVRLVSSNPHYSDLIFDVDDVDVQGIVVRIERDM
jgi:SOS-response transcriptional repressor LexA